MVVYTFVSSNFNINLSSTRSKDKVQKAFRENKQVMSKRGDIEHHQDSQH